MDGDGIGTAECVEVDVLHAARVHRDVPRVARERDPVAVRRDADGLAGRCPVEDHRVVAVPAFDPVAAVARIPDECVVAGTEIGHVVAAVAVDRVVAGPAEEQLGAGSAEQRVVAVAPGDCRRNAVRERAIRFVDPHEVIACAGIDGDRRDRLEVEPEVGRAVVTDVDLQDIAAAGLQPKCDPVVPIGPDDDESTVPKLRPLDVMRPVRARRRGRNLCLSSRGAAGHQGSDGGSRQGGQPELKVILHWVFLSEKNVSGAKTPTHVVYSGGKKCGQAVSLRVCACG